VARRAGIKETHMKKLIILLILLPTIALADAGVSLSGVVRNYTAPGDTTPPTKQTLTINEFSGKCPICEKEGKKSKVFERGCHSTLMASYAYYDEDGNYHYHDPNVTTCEYGCSNGHVFSVTK
jgi:hypothetical protein